jgi:hypothetical protein
MLKKGLCPYEKSGVVVLDMCNVSGQGELEREE